MNAKVSDTLVRSTANDTASDERISRASADVERQNEDGTILTMHQRKAMLRAEWSDDIIPAVPNDSKFHYCWLSTTNQADPIYRRLRLGDELVPYTEMTNFGAHNRVMSGEFEGCVSINEMILARVPLEMYNELMTIMHHEKPNEEEEFLKANLVTDDEDARGNQLGSLEGTGIQKLGRRTAAPKFV